MLALKSFSAQVSQAALVVKNKTKQTNKKTLLTMQKIQEMQVRFLGWDNLLEEDPVFLPRESHGQRNLVGYSS